MTEADFCNKFYGVHLVNPTFITSQDAIFSSAVFLLAGVIRSEAGLCNRWRSDCPATERLVTQPDRGSPSTACLSYHLIPFRILLTTTRDVNPPCFRSVSVLSPPILQRRGLQAGPCLLRLEYPAARYCFTWSQQTLDNC